MALENRSLTRQVVYLSLTLVGLLAALSLAAYFGL